MSASKWIFGGLGFVLGGPIGALIGVWVASLFDAPNPSPQRSTTQGDIRISIIVLLACIIKADGRVLKSEIAFVKPFLVRNFGEEGAKQALQLLKQLLEQDINPAEVAAQIRQHVNYSVRLELIHLLLEVANADGEVVDAECQVIQSIAMHMGVADADYQSLLSLYRKHEDANWAYTALEIEPSATNEEVKKAYRKMAIKYHPDKVATLGEDVQKAAEEKFKAVNHAYEAICKERGI